MARVGTHGEGGISKRSDGRLTEREVVAMVYLLLIGGHETTVNLLGTALLALLKNPDQLADLRANPDIRGAGVHGHDPLHGGAGGRARRDDSGG